MRMDEDLQPEDTLKLTVYLPSNGSEPEFSAHLDTGDGSTERFFTLKCIDLWREDEDKDVFYMIADWLERWSKALRDEAAKRWGPDDAQQAE